VRREFMAAFKRLDERNSGLQQSVGQELLQLHPGFKSEYITEQGYSVDWAWVSPDGSHKIAVEVDGPWHFSEKVTSLQSKTDMHADPPRMLGRTKLKQRLLVRFGWQLVQVPFWEWQMLPDTQKQAYLLEKIYLCPPSFCDELL